MSSLKSTIERLANDFARELLAALKEASFEDFVAEVQGAGSSGGGRPSNGSSSARSGASSNGASSAGARSGGRRVRRSDGQLSGVVDRIVTTLKDAGASGLRSEELRKKLGVPRPQMLRPLEIALESNRIRKTGTRRATTYFAR